MESLLTIARDAARRASEVVLPFYGSTTYELKDDNSPVTKADMAAHAILSEVLGATDIPILSEEDVEYLAFPYPARMWIVDPIDGTKGFLKHTDDFAVMIGLIEHGRPILGVVHVPVTNTTYFAVKDQGSFIETSTGVTRLRVSTRVEPELRGLLSVNHITPYMYELGEILTVKERVSVGSVGIKTGYIASDRADFYVNLGELGEWDVCAPEIILTEAGGVVTDDRGNLLSYGNVDARIKNGLVLSNGACHNSVLTALTCISRN